MYRFRFGRLTCTRHLLKRFSTDGAATPIGEPTKTITKQTDKTDRTKGSVDNRMSAWAIHSYGDIGELQLTRSRMPIIKSTTELLISVKAASLNPIDYMMINGYAQEFGRFLRSHQLEFPLTLGRDFSGIVIDKGQDVNNFKVGDKVYGVLPIHRQGSHAEAVIAEQSLTCMKPDKFNFIEAASILYSGLTAWSALYLSGELCIRDPKNYRVLVTGASGGVGTLAVQMLHASGAKVIASCNAGALNFVRQLGAQSVHDYRDQNYVSNMAKEGPFDIILDCANIGYDKIPPTWQYSKFITLNAPLIKNTDKYGLLGGLAASGRDLMIANIPKCATGKTVRWGFFAPFHVGVEFIDNLITQDKLRPVIHGIYAFDEVPEAFEDLMDGNLLGKIVVDMDT